MSGYIPWGHIIAIALLGVVAAVCFVLGAREMGDPDEPRSPKNTGFDDLL
jgi:hypothetical protein